MLVTICLMGARNMAVAPGDRANNVPGITRAPIGRRPPANRRVGQLRAPSLNGSVANIAERRRTAGPTSQCAARALCYGGKKRLRGTNTSSDLST